MHVDNSHNTMALKLLTDIVKGQDTSSIQPPLQRSEDMYHLYQRWIQHEIALTELQETNRQQQADIVQLQLKNQELRVNVTACEGD